ncbi:MAG: ribosome silencing factor [Rickettsiaceae bacterium]|nr:ribosome silencing factor [Rickettsiaceae bacterium]
MIKEVEELKNYIINLLEDKKAQNISVIDLGDKIPLAKYIIIASGKSVKNVAMIADFVSTEIKTNTNINVGLEGLGQSEWTLVDCGDIIIHIFHPEARERVKIEELWVKKNSKNT